MDKEKIKNYFLTEGIPDSSLMEDAFSNPSDEIKIYNILSEHWEEINSTKNIEVYNLKHLLHKLHFYINMSSFKKKDSVTVKIYSWYSKIAAVLLIPLLLAGFMYLYINNSKDSWSVLTAPKGEKAQFILPDGSKGYLNSGSTLRYKNNFNKERIVQLEGEGFFDVMKDKKHPFIVQTPVLSVTALGTRFDVCAYNDEETIRTTLESGRIKIGISQSDKFWILKPGEQNIYNRNTDISTVNMVNTDLYVSWKENILRFDNAGFIDIVKKMERWYDVKINLDDELKYTQRYTMTIKTESLKEMLDLLSVTTPINYKIQNENVYISLKNQPMAK